MNKRELNLAKIGLMALIDEATGYQEERKPDALKTFFESIDDDAQEFFESPPEEALKRREATRCRKNKT